MKHQTSYFLSFVISIIWLKSCSGQLFVTPNKTCGNKCIGSLLDPYDNILFALQRASSINSPLTIILLGNYATEHYLLTKEQSELDPQTLIYDFVGLARFTLIDVEIRPLFCDEDLVSINANLNDKCINRNQNLTIVFKPMEITLTVQKRLSMQNIVFDWSESSISVNKSDTCTNLRMRCCSTKEIQGKMECDPRFYSRQPSNKTNTYNFIELASKQNVTKSLSFNSITLKHFRDKSLRSFIRTNSNDFFELIFQNSIIDDVTFGQGLVTHSGTGSETANSSIKFSNVNFTRYNYWNREEEPSYRSWNEGYLFWADTNFKGTFSVVDSNFDDINAASMFQCEFSDPIMSNDLKSLTTSRSDIWSRYHSRTSNRESSTIYIKRLDGEMIIQRSTFQKVIGIFGSVVQVTDCSDATHFSFLDNKFDNNFGMQGFANILIASKPIRTNGKCPAVEVRNSEFTNSKGCPGSYGNIGYICYWDATPPTTSTLLSYTNLRNSFYSNYDVVMLSYPVRIFNSTFQKNIIAISNSIAIIGSYMTILEKNKFQDNGGTSAQIIFYSLENSNFLEKKPQKWNESMSSYISSCVFGQSSVLFIDRIAQLQSRNNLFQGNWGPWEGSQVLAACITIRNWLPVHTDMMLFQENIFRDHIGIPSHIKNYLVGKGQYLKNNSFTPPLISFCYDISGSSTFFGAGGNHIYISLSGIEFKSNILSFNFTDACQYNPSGLENVCSLMKNKNRYLTGLFKFLSESELREETKVDAVSITQNIKMSFSMNNTQITNNTILTDGCLFTTLWLPLYFLDNVTIDANKINPNAKYLTESPDYIEPSLDFPLKNRNGVFCYYREKIPTSLNLLRIIVAASNTKSIFIATKLNVKNNFGTILNFFPEEYNDFWIFNSIFRNNTSPCGSVVNIFGNSKGLFANNIFLENDNALGILFISLSNSLYTSVFNTYLKNNGKHASLAYVNTNAQSLEILAKIHWNGINPTYKTFADQATPQGGLYFLQSSQMNFLLSEFKQNTPYAGFIISLNSIVSFNVIRVSDHCIYGNSVIGNFFLSILNIQQSILANNSIIHIPSLQKASVVRLDKTRLNVKDLNIFQSLSDNQGGLFLGTSIQGTISNLNIQNFHSGAENVILKLESSHVAIKNLYCKNITSIFKLSKTQLTLFNISIHSLVLSSASRFLMDMTDTTLSINQLNYVEGFDSGNYLSLFTGSKNNIRIFESNFINALPGINKIFELTNTVSLFIIKSSFKYTQDNILTTIFDFKSSNQVNIQECIFVLAGRVLSADNIYNIFYFTSNTILTNAHLENIKMVNGNITYFFDNYLLQQGSHDNTIFPESQLSLLNNLGLVSLRNNILMSLFGHKGVIKVQSLTKPYNIDSNTNIFINNTGSYGGVFYLDASLSPSNESVILVPTTIIEDSIFVLNKAIHFQEMSGKGGAIYQTTSTMTNQTTKMRQSVFIKNSAEIIGGAIFFDYLPPQVDERTVFRENRAKKPNHIGSYPVKLVYYGNKIPLENEVAIQPHFQKSYSLEDSVYIWENISSGSIENRAYYFGLVDMFDQIVYDDNTSSLEIYPDEIPIEYRSLFSSKLSVKAKNGVYEFSNFKFSHKVEGYTNVIFSSSAIYNQKQIPITDGMPITLTNSVKIQAHFRRCGQGEHVLREYNVTTCEQCQPGFWQVSPNPNSPFCKPCVDTSTICLGGNYVGPKKGYWRLNDTADIVLACPRADSCLGNELRAQDNNISLHSTGKCQEGYMGNLCSNCVSGWVKLESGTCNLCKTNLWFYVRLILIIGFQIVLIIQGYRETRKFCKEYSENKSTSLNGAILIRIFTNYLQITSLVSKIPVTWPTLVKNIFSVITQVSSVSESVFSIDCIFSSGEVFGVKIVFLKLLIETLGGFFLVFLSIIFWILFYIVKKRRIIGNEHFKNTLITTAIIICFIMQPSAIQSSFSFFQCTNLYREDTPIKYFTKDYDVICWQGEHLYWALGLGLPSLTIWACILPFLIFDTIKKNRTKLKTKEVSEKYSFLYGGYTESRYYWELIIMANNFIFIAIIISASFHSSNLQIYLSILTLIAFYFIHIIGQPFSDKQLDYLKRLSLLNAAAINFCGLYFKIPSSTPEQLNILVMVIGLITNLIFLLAFVKLYFYIQIKKIRENNKLFLIILKLMRRFCCCLTTVKSKKFMEKIKTLETGRETTQPLDEMVKFSSEAPSDRPILTGATSGRPILTLPPLSPMSHLSPSSLISRKEEIILDQAFSRNESEPSYEDLHINEERYKKDEIDLRSIPTGQNMTSSPS